MPAAFDRELRRMLGRAGGRFVHSGKGSHEIWQIPVTNRRFVRPEQGQSGLVPPAMRPRCPSSELKRGVAPVFEKGLGVEAAEEFDQRRHQSGPAGLMTGADPGAVVAVKILVEQ